MFFVGNIGSLSHFLPLCQDSSDLFKLLSIPKETCIMNWMSLGDHYHLVNLSSGPCAELLEGQCGNLFYHLKLQVPPF